MSLDIFLDSSENINSMKLNFKEIEKELTKNIKDDKHSHFHEKEKIENIVVHINLKTKQELDNKIGNLIWNLPEFYSFSFIRFKGVFYSDDGFIYSIQGLYDLYEITAVKKYTSRDQSKILLIGRHLKENENVIEKFFS
jgi:G3E family GTPase